jgi:hypothetical protein
MIFTAATLLGVIYFTPSSINKMSERSEQARERERKENKTI